VLNDFRFALRSLRKSPSVTAVAVVTLALGVGATTTLFTIVNAVRRRPLPYPHADRIVSISEEQDGKDGQVVAYRLKANLEPKSIEKARTELNGKNKYTWLSENWQQYFEPVPIEAGIATLERVEVVSGLAAGDQVALEDPTRKKVERDDDVD